VGFWAVVFVVLMLFWLVGGSYWAYEPARPYLLGNTLLPWLCVAILGYIVLTGQVVAVIR
jgi:hypothetical protein